MRQLDADSFGAFEHGDRRCGAGNQPDDRSRGFAFRRIGRIDQRVVDDRRSAHVGYAVLPNQFEDLGGVDLAQANIDARGRRDGPREAPAVAVEHRQRPEIDRMLAEIAREDIADGVQVGAAVMGHNALRIACCARCVTERDGIPLVFRQPRREAGVALRQRVLVFDLADAFTAREIRIVDIDDERLRPLHQFKRL
jgi:hypothetical protein